MKKLRFGTAGIPLSTKNKDSMSGIRRIKELGLEGMELEFVRGVRIGKNTALKINEIAKNIEITLSVHAPYYINLNSKETEKVVASRKRILQSAIIGDLCGATGVVFHPAYYQKDSPFKVYKKIKKHLKDIIQRLQNEKIQITLRPETTGKPTQFGTLEEILNLSMELDGVLPCIDFAHLHARTGKNNTYSEFHSILSMIENNLGKESLEDMHIHVSGIEYEIRGEKRHLILKESDFNYQDLLKAWKEFDIKGLVICESPNLEGDALLLKEEYYQARENLRAEARSLKARLR